MTLKIISAQEIIFEGKVTSVTLPGTMGAFTVLRNHASLISTLSPGIVRYTETESGVEHENTIAGGIVDVNDNVVSVCVS